MSKYIIKDLECENLRLIKLLTNVKNGTILKRYNEAQQIIFDQTIKIVFLEKKSNRLEIQLNKIKEIIG